MSLPPGVGDGHAARSRRVEAVDIESAAILARNRFRDRSVSPVAVVPPIGLPSGSTTVSVDRAAGVDLEVHRRRLGLGVDVELGQDVVIE